MMQTLLFRTNCGTLGIFMCNSGCTLLSLAPVIYEASTYSYICNAIEIFFSEEAEDDPGWSFVLVPSCPAFNSRSFFHAAAAVLSSLVNGLLFLLGAFLCLQAEKLLCFDVDD